MIGGRRTHSGIPGWDMSVSVSSFTSVTRVDRWGQTSPGVLDHMVEVFGEDSFDDGKEESRFQPVLDSGTQLGDDLQNIFDQLKLKLHGEAPEQELPEDTRDTLRLLLGRQE